MVTEQIILPHEMAEMSVGEIKLSLNRERPFGDAMKFVASEEFSQLHIEMQYSIINTAIDLFKTIAMQMDREIKE